ncbi:MAG: DUF2017 family protein [Ilumatobacteraceae bacterium]
MARPRPPIERRGDGYRLHIGDDELALLRRLLGELRQLLVSDSDEEKVAGAMLTRLFPVAYPDDADLEAEYQRLMRSELVTSKLAAIDIVENVIDGAGAAIDESQLTAFMQSINSVRLVLGTLLDVTDDPDAEVVTEYDDTAEYQLYSYLSWLLEWSVRALSGA